MNKTIETNLKHIETTRELLATAMLADDHKRCFELSMLINALKDEIVELLMIDQKMDILLGSSTAKAA